jgi:hypothetical protein
MKTQHTLIALMLGILLCTQNSFASHNAGGDISYTHISGNDYLIHCTLYRDCFGISAPTSITVHIESASCSQSQMVNMNAINGTGQEVTQMCPTVNSTCNGGFAPGYQKWEYETTVTLSGQCPDWIFYVSDCCRNQAITTLSNAGALGFYMEAKLDNSTSDNSSPQFTVDPFWYVCDGQDVYFNNGAVDPDGDSLVYVVISPRSDANTNLPYNPGYSVSNPLSSTPPFSLDAVTGDVFIHPTAVEVGVIVYMILEYRNGNLIGSVMRDVQIYTHSCTNDAPFLTGINGTNQYSLHVLPGVSTCFDIFSFDNDTSDSLLMVWNNAIPSANFSSFPNPLPAGTFCWTPGIADVRSQPYNFCVTISDNNCPENNRSVYSFLVFVTLDSSLVTPLTTQGYITGKVYYDMDGSNSKDPNEPFLSHQRVDIAPDNIALYSVPGGDYRFYGWMAGTHFFTIAPPVNWIGTQGAGGYTVTDDTIVQPGFDFGINSPLLYNQIDASMVNAAPRCNSIVNHWITYQNIGSTIANGRILLIYDPATLFIASTIAPDSVTGDTVYFNFSNVNPFDISSITVQLEYPAPGDTLDLQVIAQYDSAGNYYTSYTQDIHPIVICPIDPNDKTVLPEGIFAEHRTLYTDPLLYTVRFQNTGTAPANTVFVQDFIDPALDISTLHIMGSSHPMTTTIYPNRMVEFRFENIMLPDSGADYLRSQGFVQYRIEANQGLLLPLVVNNQANIFFDSNLPVLTNNVFNTLVSDLYVGTATVEGTSEKLLVVPNPFTQQAEIQLSKSFTNDESHFRLFDELGNMVDDRNVNGSSIIISRGKLQTGIYFFELKNDLNRATGKIIIE